jgi:hypothetical protein
MSAARGEGRARAAPVKRQMDAQAPAPERAQCPRETTPQGHAPATWPVLTGGTRHTAALEQLPEAQPAPASLRGCAEACNGLP